MSFMACLHTPELKFPSLILTTSVRRGPHVHDGNFTPEEARIQTQVFYFKTSLHAACPSNSVLLFAPVIQL